MSVFRTFGQETDSTDDFRKLPGYSDLPPAVHAKIQEAYENAFRSRQHLGLKIAQGTGYALAKAMVDEAVLLEKKCRQCGHEMKEVRRQNATHKFCPVCNPKSLGYGDNKRMHEAMKEDDSGSLQHQTLLKKNAEEEPFNPTHLTGWGTSPDYPGESGTDKLADDDFGAEAILKKNHTEKGLTGPGVAEDEELVPGHLPVGDRRHMGAAWAALHGGYRGNKYEGPDKAKAKAKLNHMYKEKGIPTPAQESVVLESSGSEFESAAKEHGFHDHGAVMHQTMDHPSGHVLTIHKYKPVDSYGGPGDKWTLEHNGKSVAFGHGMYHLHHELGKVSGKHLGFAESVIDESANPFHSLLTKHGYKRGKEKKASGDYSGWRAHMYEHPSGKTIEISRGPSGTRYWHVDDKNMDHIISSLKKHLGESVEGFMTEEEYQLFENSVADALRTAKRQGYSLHGDPKQGVLGTTYKLAHPKGHELQVHTDHQGMNWWHSDKNGGKSQGASPDALQSRLRDVDEAEMMEKYVGFEKLEKKFSHKKGIYDPAGLAASIGRKKYGSKGFSTHKHGVAEDEDKHGNQSTTIDPKHPSYIAGHKLGTKLGGGFVPDPNKSIHSSSVDHIKKHQGDTLQQHLDRQRQYKAGALAGYKKAASITEESSKEIQDRTFREKCDYCNKTHAVGPCPAMQESEWTGSSPAAPPTYECGGDWGEGSATDAKSILNKNHKDKGEPVEEAEVLEKQDHICFCGHGSSHHTPNGCRECKRQGHVVPEKAAHAFKLNSNVKMEQVDPIQAAVDYISARVNVHGIVESALPKQPEINKKERWR